MLGLVTIVTDARRSILVAGAVGAFLVVALTVVRPAKFSSTVLLVPTGPSAGALSQLGGLASQLGLGDAVAGGASPTASVAFMAKLATSDVILGRLVDDSVVVGPDSSVRTTLLAVAAPAPLLQFGEPESDPRRRVRALKELRRWIAARSDRETGSARIAVRTKWPGVSLRIAERIAVELNHLNIELATARAASERRFLEERVENQRRTLRGAEELLQRFLEANREFGSSASLTFARDRLQRDVQLQQQLLTSLSQSLEDARLREVQNTPVVTVVEPALFPHMAEDRKVIQRAVLGFLGLSTLWLTGVILLRLLEARAAAGDGDAARLLALAHRWKLTGRRT